MPNSPPPYSVSNDSITVVINGTPSIVRREQPNFAGLKRAILEENWDDLPKYLTVSHGLQEWAKGEFTVDGNVISHKGKPVPERLNARILRMATAGQDPTPLFKFWEKLQKNPSFRSVQQLWGFLENQGIPLTEDGCFLAYKLVNENLTDKHTGTVHNDIGSKHEMDRNLVSDDPNQTCHYGFHVGALEYVRNGGVMGTGKVIICKVDPEHVVCVPNDHSAQKMRVCKYEVIGHHGSQMPSSVIAQEDIPQAVEGDSDEDELEDGDDLGDSPPLVETSVTEPGAPYLLKVPRAYRKYQVMSGESLLACSLDEMRQYATHGLKIVGASKIPGGKVALVGRILEVRGLVDTHE